MDHEQKESPTKTNNLVVYKKDGKDSIEFIDSKFRISNTVEHLHEMMIQVTKKDFSPQNVQAACHVVAKLNETLNSVINAARFLNENKS